jgi:carboxymethylenebutenolidase
MKSAVSEPKSISVPVPEYKVGTFELDPLTQTKMNVFVQEPMGPGPHPAMIVFQEAFGVNKHIQSICQRYAELGFITYAPELFHRVQDGLILDYTDFARVRPQLGMMTTQHLLADAVASFEALKSNPRVAKDKIFAIGYCMGGYTSMLAASFLALAGAVSYYGGGMVAPRPGIGFLPITEYFGKINCPVQLVFGGQDQGIPLSEVETIRGTLTSLKKNFEIEVYGEAGHGFFCEDRSAYHAASAGAAWKKTEQWLSRYL